ncbi:lysylphosphatidylglycerol synthase transmembrane domain-containing protein [Brevibacillus ginsengisoli]|uniref:lysylphosphatidylglycerol synthase transmembrane domain-containing protein n=1 Tax=Brevibacillus ginsengisoli TaxID=363854 RepID=UPI003CF08AEB
MNKKTIGIWGIRLIIFAAFVYLCLGWFDLKLVANQLLRLLAQPIALLLMTVLYGMAFVLRAVAWRRYLHDHVSFKVCLHALFYSLFINHILPFKVGEVVRAGYLVQGKHASWDEAAHSVIVLRSLDVLTLGLFSGIGVLVIGLRVSWFAMIGFVLGIMLVIGLVYFLSKQKLSGFLHKHVRLMKQAMSGTSGVMIVSLTAISWLLEAFVVIGVAHALKIKLSFLQGVWVTSMTIAGQTFNFTPGGIGTYESVMSFSLAAVGMSLSNAYAVALLSHGFKFIFSFAAGAYVLITSPVSLRDVRKWTAKKKLEEQK